MLDDLWNGFLELTAQFVIPDWGAVVALLPILVIFLVVAILLWVFLKLFHQAPARRGKARIEPLTPAGIHMPGPSFAPIVASFGAFLLFLGLVFGGLVLVVGAIGLVVGLLYWLREALRVYEHDTGATTPALPAVIHPGPPPGVHMPGPSYRPFLGALGAAMLMLGLVFGEWVLAVGVIALIVTLLGWLVDARKEYVKTEEADTTGHLENIPDPRTPSLLFVGLGILLVGAVLIQGGWVPPRGASGGEVPVASGPPVSGPSGEPAGAEASPPAADVTVTAKGIAFLTTSITAPADKPFTLAFVNDDDGIPHNVELKDAGGAVAYLGEIFPGIATKVYDVPALPAGAYTFLCTVHPSMTGTATVQ
ncbi:MAG: aa3-type cytochrome oxidase subunit IV [Candidatus Limnocylindrales bacterium]